MSTSRGSGKARPWHMALPLGVVIVLMTGWVIYWFVGANFAEARIDRLIARQAERGTEITCGERTFGGFPFRFTVTCSDARLVLNRSGQVIEIALPELHGIVQAYNLAHAIAEFTGPMDVLVRRTGEPDQQARVTWSNALASVQTSGLEFSGGDLSAENLTIWSGRSPSDLTGDPVSTIARYEGHIRRSTAGDGAGSLPDFDFATSASDFTLQMPAPARGTIALDEASLSGTAFDLPLNARDNVQQFLRNWQQSGGKLDIGQLWIDGTDTAINAAGALMLSPSGRPDGDLAIDIAGIDQLLRQVNQSAGSSVSGMAQFLVLMVKNIATPSDIDGTPALRIDVEFDDGVTKIQGNAVSRIGPLYPTPGS